MQKIITVVAYLVITLTCSSQSLKLLCGDTILNYDNGNLDHFSMVVNCPYEETDTLHLPEAIYSKAKKYLANRTGADFSNRLKYYACQVVDFGKFKQIKKEKGWVSGNSDKRVKYAIQYFFSIEDSMRYYLSIVFDKDGNIISKHQLPDYKIDPHFYEIQSVCVAREIAEADSVFEEDKNHILRIYRWDKCICMARRENICKRQTATGGIA